MAQIKTQFFPETIYHVYSHANGSENLFRNDNDYTIFLTKYSKYLYAMAETYAYCLMPNHFHFMIRIRSEVELLKAISDFKTKRTCEDLKSPGVLSDIISRQFGHLLNSHTQWYNNRYERSGSLFTPNIKRIAVEDEVYMTRLIAYIHNNPVHHGFCENMLDWPHSSIHAYLLNKPTKLEKGFMEKWFGSKDLLLKFHQENCNWRPVEIFC